MKRKVSGSETWLPPPLPSPVPGEGVESRSNPLPRNGGGLGRGPKRSELSAPEGKFRTKTKSLKRARVLRRQMTDAEQMLWKHLRRRQLHGFHFRKQCPIGPYIADFACLEAKLIIEVDGGQHADSGHDAARDAWMAAHGCRTLRFWNTDILPRAEGALTKITEALGRLETTEYAQAH
ncbi:MAG TPA: DUF559 domain-containing protein [Dongiaceae bacterium]|nr:DUF559 domain-containing protein [Dongiaceae bacterium]